MSFSPVCPAALSHDALVSQVLADRVASSRTLESDRNLRRAALVRGLRNLVCSLTPFYGGQGVPGGKPRHNPARRKRKRHDR